MTRRRKTPKQVYKKRKNERGEERSTESGRKVNKKAGKTENQVQRNQGSQNGNHPPTRKEKVNLSKKLFQTLNQKTQLEICLNLKKN